MMVTFDIDKKGRGLVSGEEVPRLRERFSVENKAAKFGRFRGGFAPFRKYVITPAGRFNVGMYFEFKKFLKDQYPDIKIIKTPAFREYIFPYKSVNMEVPDLKLPLRDYQRTIVSTCNKVGRGVVVLATAGGKTLTIASLIQSVYNSSDKNNFTCLLVVPDIGLVNQTNGDFTEYGVGFSHCKWTGNHGLNLKCNVIICNMGILQSKKSDLSFLDHVDLLIVDEVHKLRSGNKINKILSKIPTKNRYGFTGTMPEELEDQWNIIGTVGPILYEKSSFALRQEKYIAKARVIILRLTYTSRNDQPAFDHNNFDPTARYRKELEKIHESVFRNNIISKICSNTANNTLLLVDHINHGQLLYNKLSTVLTDKQVYFIRGEVEIEERERIRALMEERSDIICIAISKIFSTGVNIKNLHYIMFCSGGKAKVKIVQSIGRGLRTHKSKTILTIIDIADQLYYGKLHMNKRVLLYEQENFSYEYQTIEEKTT
tara:strand:+ start:2052 stop:3509 length:1458 start_codon:yes stop_codon:yes gene_type:complete